jgi:predicted transcriptional regulator
MDGKPLPSPSEWQVFACLSRSGPSTLKELTLKLPHLQPFTIETLLLRLAEKGYSSPKNDSNRFLALVPFHQALEAQRLIHATVDPADTEEGVEIA